MRILLYIFIGGGLGSVLRFLISNYTQRLWFVNSFPFGTFVVNFIGCFLIGLFSSYILKNDSNLKFLLIAGFCGGFTTFSAFAFENIELWKSGQYSWALIYTIITVVVCFLAVILGFRVSNNL